VIEHLYPRELLVAELLDGTVVAETAGAIEVLTERLMAAVVTRDEDRAASNPCTVSSPVG